MNCSDFVARFTDYVDGYASPDDSREMEAHLSACPSCSRYWAVLRHGSSVLRSLPEPELRDDFAPRLQHRLYHVSEERALSDQAMSGAPAFAVLGIAVLLAAIAWLPAVKGGAPVLQLDPIIVDHAPVSFRPVQVDAPPAAAPAAGQRPAQLDEELWDGTRIYEYSPLARRYQVGSGARQVGFSPDQ